MNRLLYLFPFVLLQSCMTAHDVYIPNPVGTEKANYSVGVFTTIPTVSNPSNIGLNLQGNTKRMGTTPFQLNYFARTQLYLRDVVQSFKISGANLQETRYNSISGMLMPTYIASEDERIGLGLGVNAIYDKNGYSKSIMTLGTASFNITNITKRTESLTRYFNVGVNFSHRLNAYEGITSEIGFKNNDSTQSYTTYSDHYGFAQSNSVKFSFVTEKWVNSPNMCFRFQFDFGFAYYGDILGTTRRKFQNLGPNTTFESASGYFNFPIGITFGIGF